MPVAIPIPDAYSHVQSAGNKKPWPFFQMQRNKTTRTKFETRKFSVQLPHCRVDSKAGHIQHNRYRQHGRSQCSEGRTRISQGFSWR
jgi:hypothetical protein